MARRKIACADCETDPFKLGRVPVPFIWGIYNGDEYEEFETVEKLIEYCENKKWVVYFHNGGKFDYFFMLDHLEAFSDITIINGRLSKFKIGECEFRDSINILPLPLRALQKDDFDYNLLEKGVREKNMPKIRAYLESDCRNLYKFVSAFIDLYGLNLTIASTALKQWKKINKDVPESGADFYDNFKKYYYGGRVECFEKGIFEGNFESYDINSAYPFAMLDVHPYGTFYIERIPENDCEIIPQNFYTIDATASGCLPLRTKTGLEFPHIREIFHVTGWEIKAGLETGTLIIHDIQKEIAFPEKTDFKEYVDHFYEIKQKADKKSPEYTFAKLFMNSLYGKFAANPEKYNEFIIMDKKYIEASMKDGYEFSGELGQWGLMRKPLDDEKKKYYNVCTAASITGYVRSFLWRYIHENNKNGNKVLYCDTDCIFFEKKIDKVCFDVGEALGQWDKEGEYTKGAIAGKKLYSFWDENKQQYKKASKGCNLSGKEIFSIANDEEILYKDIVPVFSVYKEPYFQERKIRKT